MAEGKKHFLETERAELVKYVNEVKETLDKLQSEELLTKEQCANIKAERTTQDKVRLLLDYSHGWGDSTKERLCYYLREENKEVAVLQRWKLIQANIYDGVSDGSGASEGTATRNGQEGLTGGTAANMWVQKNIYKREDVDEENFHMDLK